MSGRGRCCFFWRSVVWDSCSKPCSERRQLELPGLRSALCCTVGKPQAISVPALCSCVHCHGQCCDTWACVCEVFGRGGVLLDIRGKCPIRALLQLDGEGFSLAPPSLTGRSRVATGTKHAIFTHFFLLTSLHALKSQ